jgi:hypothetical protein
MFSGTVVKAPFPPENASTLLRDVCPCPGGKDISAFFDFSSELTQLFRRFKYRLYFVVSPFKSENLNFN